MSWKHPNLGVENLNDLKYTAEIGLALVQDSPIYIGLHSIFGTCFHIRKTACFYSLMHFYSINFCPSNEL
jgi:hypothetical protein